MKSELRQLIVALMIGCAVWTVVAWCAETRSSIDWFLHIGPAGSAFMASLFAFDVIRSIIREELERKDAK